MKSIEESSKKIKAGKMVPVVAASVTMLNFFLQMGGMTVHAAEEKEIMLPVDVPYETPEEIAEEEYYDSLELLALCVEAEAGNQDLYGKRLVVDVILNRVDDPDWEDDITGVIQEKNQFSTWGNGAIERVREASAETYIAIQMELDQRTRRDVFYFTAGNYGNYGTPLFRYGDHYFSGK